LSRYDILLNKKQDKAVLGSPLTIEPEPEPEQVQSDAEEQCQLEIGCDVYTARFYSFNQGASLAQSNAVFSLNLTIETNVTVNTFFNKMLKFKYGRTIGGFTYQFTLLVKDVNLNFINLHTTSVDLTGEIVHASKGF